MSAAAALRSACRALGRPSSFPGGLLGKPRFSRAVDNFIPRRLYHTSGRITKADGTEVTTNPFNLATCIEINSNENWHITWYVYMQQIITDLGRIDQKADKLNDILDETLIRLEHLKQVMREKNKRARYFCSITSVSCL